MLKAALFGRRGHGVSVMLSSRGRPRCPRWLDRFMVAASGIALTGFLVRTLFTQTIYRVNVLGAIPVGLGLAFALADLRRHHLRGRSNAPRR